MANVFGAVTLTSGLSITHHSIQDYGENSFTVEISMKCSSDGTLMQKFSSSIGWKLEVISSVVKATLNDTILVGSTNVSDNGWHHVTLSVNRETNSADLHVDGTYEGGVDISSLASVSNAVATLVGSNGTTFLPCSVTEIRFTKDKAVYSAEGYYFEGQSLADSGFVVGLYHFNEGAGSVAYDMAASTRNHISLSGHTYIEGPYCRNPITIVRDHFWLALDSYEPLTRFLNHRLTNSDSGSQVYDGKVRYRDGDDIPHTFTPVNTPAIIIVPTSLSDLNPETSAYHKILLPIEIQGYLYAPKVCDIENLWWLCLQAVFSMYNKTSTAGRMNFVGVQNVKSRGPSWEIAEMLGETLFSSFDETFLVEIHHDLLS
jgi:hypothetical protein